MDAYDYPAEMFEDPGYEDEHDYDTNINVVAADLDEDGYYAASDSLFSEGDVVIGRRLGVVKFRGEVRAGRDVTVADGSSISAVGLIAAGRSVEAYLDIEAGLGITAGMYIRTRTGGITSGRDIFAGVGIYSGSFIRAMFSVESGGKSTGFLDGYGTISAETFIESGGSIRAVLNVSAGESIVAGYEIAGRMGISAGGDMVAHCGGITSSSYLEAGGDIRSNRSVSAHNITCARVIAHGEVVVEDKIHSGEVVAPGILPTPEYRLTFPPLAAKPRPVPTLVQKAKSWLLRVLPK